MNEQARSATKADVVEKEHGLAQIAEDGLFAGMIGALMVAVWFLILDTIAGRPLYTPSLLGKVLFQGARAMDDPTIVPSMVVVYTGLHMAAFILVGMLAAYLVAASERTPAIGILLLFFFVIFEAAFFVYSLAVGGGLVGRLGVTAVLIANLLAAGGMATYFFWRHPRARQSLDKTWEEA
jgi:hypothetical protein